MSQQGNPFKAMKLQEFINWLGILPSFILRKYQIVLSSPQEEAMFESLRSYQLGVADWMDWLIEPSRPKPPELTGIWGVYESAALMSEARLKLARATRDKSKILTVISHSSDHLWFAVEASDFLRSVSEAGFGAVLGLGYAEFFPSILNGPSPLGKVEYLSRLREDNRYMDDPGLRSPSNVDINVDLGLHLESVLVQEAIEADKAYPGFKEDYLDPYIHTREWFTKKVKNTPELQLTYLLADGSLHITKKGSKRPKPQGFEPKRSRGRPSKGSNVKKC